MVMRLVSLKIKVFVVLTLICNIISAQIQVTAFATLNSSGASTTYNGVKGAGLLSSSGSLFSSWDSTGSSFTVNYGGTTSSVTSVTQLTVSGYASAFTPLYFSNALVKVRRLANSYVNDTRTYFAVWATYSAAPATGATSGTFTLVPPEMTDPEVTFLTNNINIGIDDIFQNTIKDLYANNIERVDYVLPSGIKATNQTDLDGTGVLVLDRGAGDPFKIAAILSVDATNKPTSYGPLVAVSKAQYGPKVVSSANYCMLIHDPKFGTASRPTTVLAQGLAGVLVTLTNLGVAANQPIYGYSLFGYDVSAANTDWTTYPTNSDSTAVLDPASVFGFWRTSGVLLANSNRLRVSNDNGHALLHFSLGDAIQQRTVRIERSRDGNIFERIATLEQPGTGEHSFFDPASFSGRVFYRLQFVGQQGATSYSEVQSITISATDQIRVSPNPCAGQFTISLPAAWQQQAVRATLLTSDGRTVQSEDLTAAPSKQFFLKNTSVGTYYLRIENKASGETKLLPVLVTK